MICVSGSNNGSSWSRWGISIQGINQTAGQIMKCFVSCRSCETASIRIRQSYEGQHKLGCLWIRFGYDLSRSPHCHSGLGCFPSLNSSVFGHANWLKPEVSNIRRQSACAIKSEKCRKPYRYEGFHSLFFPQKVVAMFSFHCRHWSTPKIPVISLGDSALRGRDFQRCVDNGFYRRSYSVCHEEIWIRAAAIQTQSQYYCTENAEHSCPKKKKKKKKNLKKSRFLSQNKTASCHAEV